MVNNVVINLSSYKPTLDELSVINRGLGFVPAHYKPKYDTINNDLLRFERKLQLHFFFCNKSDLKDSEPTKYVTKTLEGNSTWWPKKLNPHITSFCYNLKHSIFNLLARQRVKNNLSSSEISAIVSLKKNKDIIIKKADKGGGITILNSKDYLDKVHVMLSDSNTYLPVSIDDTLTVKFKVDCIIDALTTDGFLTAKQCKYLKDFHPRCPLFYGLPKIHKVGIPLRPIVSQINGPTSRLNELVDTYLTIAEKNIPFLLQDTTAYLRLLEKYKCVSPGTFLVTMDVTSLYTNIPHVEGARWVADFYEETLSLWDFAFLKPIDKLDLYRLILVILTNTTFQFDDGLYTQLFGTTMGAKFSVKFANIYMHCWLDKFTKAYTGSKPCFIARLIDDCFFLWSAPLSELHDFISYLNCCHTSIKFEVTFSLEKVCFLDTITFIADDIIHTNIYTKPTDKKQYLFFNSSHPKHTTLSIPYSQALRYRRVIDDNSMLNTQLDTLCGHFLSRGYPKQLLVKTMDKVRLLTRSSLLDYRDEVDKRAKFEQFLDGKTFLPLIIPFHQALDQNFKHTFKTLWLDFIKSDRNISCVFCNESPQIVYKKGVTLGSILTSSKFTSHTDDTVTDLIELAAHAEPFQVTPCYHALCKCCSHILKTSTYRDSKGLNVHYIDDIFNCNSSDVVYLITCLKCNKLYVGQTKRMLKERLNNHRSDIVLRKPTAIGIHFNEPLHNISHLSITPLVSLFGLSDEERLALEFQFMKLLNTFYPVGLNHYPIVI